MSNNTDVEHAFIFVSKALPRYKSSFKCFNSKIQLTLLTRVVVGVTGSH